MNRRILLFILLVYSKLLFSDEVTLSSEIFFICDVLEKNPNSIIILYKDQKYKIPKNEILEINPDITGKHISYKKTILTLTDGSVVKGVLAEETPDLITLKKGNDLLSIPRETIVRFQKADNETYSLPEKYRIIEKEKSSSTWNLGFYGTGLKNGNRLGEYNYASYGGGFFLEPSFLKLNDRWLFGLQSEYIFSEGGLAYSFFQNFVYVQFNHVLLDLNFYYKIGIGTRYTTLIENGQSANSLNAVGNLEFGWQNSITDKYFLRVGVRGNGIYEKPLTLDMIGVQISVGYRF